MKMLFRPQLLEKVAQHSRGLADIVRVDVECKGENEIPKANQLAPGGQ